MSARSRMSGEAAASRRGFLRKAVCLALWLVPTRVLLAAPLLPPRARGGASSDVRRHGASGDGKHDDTRAFQAAVDALPQDGGTVLVPAGTYLIDPTRSVRLRSRMRLQMAPDARLVVKPNVAERAYVLNVQGVEDVEISGGRIVGDRDRHLGKTGEWGHGIMIRGSSRVTVRDMHISKCWGDGISIGAISKRGRLVLSSRDVVIAGVTCTGNRRQGLTIGRSRQVRVYDSEFSDTAGTLPACGIDVEPDAGDSAHDVLIDNCRVLRNQGAGIQLYKRVVDATVRGCEIEGNRGNGIAVIGAADCTIDNNLIRNNGLAGVGVRPGSRGILVSGNRFAGNLPKASFTAPSSGKRRWRHVAIATGTHAVKVADSNLYSD